MRVTRQLWQHKHKPLALVIMSKGLSLVGFGSIDGTSCVTKMSSDLEQSSSGRASHDNTRTSFNHLRSGSNLLKASRWV